MIHSLESILDVYPNEIGRIKTKDFLPTENTNKNENKSKSKRH